MDYFFIASQDEPSKVLDIARSKHGGQLCIWPVTGNNNQLWTLNEKGQLISKISLAAEVVNVMESLQGLHGVGLALNPVMGLPPPPARGRLADISRGVGAKVVGLSPNDSPKQQWMFEDGKLMSGLSENLYMEVDGDDWIQMKSSSNSKRQLWTIVPEKMLDHYKLMKEADNPLLEASFYRNVYTNHFGIVSGFNSIAEFEKGMEKSLIKMRKHADQLDKVNQDTAIAGTVGGAASTAGGVMGILGVVLALPTAGASLALTAGGAALGVAGGVTSFTATTINNGWEKSEREAFTAEIKKIFRLQGFIHTLIQKMTSAAKFLETDQGKKAILEHLELSKAWDAVKTTGTVMKLPWKGYTVYNTAVKTYQTAKTYTSAMKWFKDFGLADWYVMNGSKQGLAVLTSAPGIQLPKFLGGKVLVHAASSTAKAISSGFAAVGAVFGIWEMTSSIIKINNGSKMATEFRKAANKVETTVKNIVDFDKEISE